MRILKVVSGGQTGADQGALEGAREAGVATGGIAPLGWWTENGPAPWLGATYGLSEAARAGYAVRTIANVVQADATLIVARELEGGTRLTVTTAARRGKPHLVVPFEVADARERVLAWLATAQPRVLNVAGHRESRCPGIQAWVRELLRDVLLEP